LKLAEFYAGPLQNKAKALEYAKKARELAPSDREVARVLGRVAYQSGNWTWAYSLLQESSRQMPDNPGVQHDFAWAAYSVGKLAEAQQAMQRVANTGAASAEAEDAKSFLTFVSAEPAAASATAAQAQEVLKTKADYVPALMVDAEARRARGDTKGAEEIYSRVLQRFPEFAPAMRELARIYSADPASTAKAYDLATKARKSLPEDPELGRILGAIHYRKKEYGQAVQAFQQSARKKPLEAQSLFFLGMSQLSARQEAQGRQALEQALAAGLNGPDAEEARQALEQKP
jgi:tetratricopeptide (TPR) repeat protein